MKLTLCSRYHQ